MGDMEALNRAIGIFGTQSALASEIDVIPQTLNNWIARGRVPADYCPDIERATGGKVRCEELRPDVNWAYLRATSTEVT